MVGRARRSYQSTWWMNQLGIIRNGSTMSMTQRTTRVIWRFSRNIWSNRVPHMGLHTQIWPWARPLERFAPDRAERRKSVNGWYGKHPEPTALLLDHALLLRCGG